MEASQNMGVLLVSHGKCCEGLLDTLDMVAGEQKDVAAIPLVEGMDPEAYRAKIESWLDAYGDNAIVLIDILGGTPFNQIMQIARTRTVHALTGMSVPMALEASVMRYSMHPTELVEYLRTSLGNSVQSIEDLIGRLGSDDDDDEE